MLIIPIRTESAVRKTPAVNYFLIALNVGLFLILNESSAPKAWAAFKHEHLHFQAHAPAFHQFLTYQFIHAHAIHLLGNMVFLWVFGNSVNAKMGDWPYLMFYIGGGVFAAWSYGLINPGYSELVGASGAIAAVTTAYLALFPRSHVTVMVWLFVFIQFFEWPAMILIMLKIIVWDNIIGPSIVGTEGVAHTAHLAGYLFGFIGALLMLLARALPRDQFDILALWSRWRRRREMASAMTGPVSARAGALYTGASGKVSQEGFATEAEVDRIADLRSRISQWIERGKVPDALAAHEQLIGLDERQCLSERHQLAIARQWYAVSRFPQAAAAFERFIDCYPRSLDVNDVRLLLGIIYARDLHQWEAADKHLTQALPELKEGARRAQCLEWLETVRSRQGRSMPEL